MSSEFFEKYKHKIITVERLISFLSRGSKREKTILCHGVFDVVHPGHVRHLAYAKSQADILIVSITADKYIDKGAYRPHIPEKMRALNLAAFEMVDYVLIDDNKKPLKLLNKLKPDFFAKGFEYTSKGLPTATQEEKNVLDKFGGKIYRKPRKGHKMQYRWRKAFRNANEVAKFIAPFAVTKQEKLLQIVNHYVNQT